MIRSRPVPAPKVGLVLLNYRDAALTIEAHRAALALAYPALEVVVADNGSGDGSAERLRAAGIAVLETGANLGFAGGNNIAMRARLVRPIKPTARRAAKLIP